jgi:uncharacterized protein (DUF1810 family)
MASAADPYNLQRFLTAQESIYRRALLELRAGQKRGHWMWYIFPQIEGLGASSESESYAIRTLSEARGYLEHPVLGMRIRECAQAVVDIDNKALNEIFVYPDDLKFRSSMTLFAHATAENEVFTAALGKYCRGLPDPKTLALI